MKKYFYLGAIGLIFFEIANVYFIMPMPGSQQFSTLQLAYFLYHYRWIIRGVFALLMLLGFASAFTTKRYVTLFFLALVAASIYMPNFYMAADHMFYQPTKLVLKNAADNQIKVEKLVIGVEINGEAKAYPIQLISYHHQVLDTVGGKPVMVTYCSVCRTGRIFEPLVDGQPERFRLVGMDHFNAMFEDASTHSWWQQATGEAVAGPLKGKQLPELFSRQTTLKKWIELFPNTLIMQPDSTFSEEYADMDSYDTGKGRGKLTGTDTASWHDKSWVIGVHVGNENKAYDWNHLVKARIIQDVVDTKPIFLVIAADNQSFFAFERPDSSALFQIQGDTLIQGEQRYNLEGYPLNASKDAVPLKKINAYQEFWHSWRFFHPGEAESTGGGK